MRSIMWNVCSITIAMIVVYLIIIRNSSQVFSEISLPIVFPYIKFSLCVSTRDFDKSEMPIVKPQAALNTILIWLICLHVLTKYILCAFNFNFCLISLINWILWLPHSSVHGSKIPWKIQIVKHYNWDISREIQF
jgi:hypothetical protein